MIVGHGIEELPREERDQIRRTLERAQAIGRGPQISYPPQPQVQTQYVRMPEPDYLAEGYRQALAAEAKTNDHYQPFAMRIERMAQHIADSLRTKDRIMPDRRPADIVVEPPRSS